MELFIKYLSIRILCVLSYSNRRHTEIQLPSEWQSLGIVVLLAEYCIWQHPKNTTRQPVNRREVRKVSHLYMYLWFNISNPARAAQHISNLRTIDAWSEGALIVVTYIRCEKDICARSERTSSAIIGWREDNIVWSLSCVFLYTMDMWQHRCQYGRDIRILGFELIEPQLIR